MTALTQEIVRELLDYDPATGKFWWRDRGDHWFPAPMYRKMWNKKFGGKEAFTFTTNHGYKKTAIFNKQEYAHRIAWLYSYGYLPIEADHVNGDRGDNRLANLREVTRQENRKNAARRRDNSSGICGVYRHSKNNCWYADIMVDGKTKYLGSFDTIEAAATARRNAELEFGYHRNHGR